jgi:hypothetical protein
VVSERRVRRWQNLYRETSEIDLKTPSGGPKIVRTKGLMHLLVYFVFLIQRIKRLKITMQSAAI